MAKLQYIFGNPTKRKSRGKSMKKRRTRKKNPYKVNYRVTKKVTGPKGKTKTEVLKKTSGGYAAPTPGEMKTLSARLTMLREKRTSARTPAAKKRYTAQLAKLKKMYERELSKADLAKVLDKTIKEELRDVYPGATVTGKRAYAHESKTTKRKKKKVAKKKTSKKRKTTKKKVIKRKPAKRKTTKRKTTKRKPAKKKVVRRKRKVTKRKASAEVRLNKKSTSVKARIPKNLKRKKSVSTKWKSGKKKGRVTVTRKNPIGGNGMRVMGQKITSYDKREFAALGIGGLAYGGINVLLSKIPGISGVQSFLARSVPVIGGSLGTFLAGATVNILNTKYMRNNQYLAMLGDGLVAASVVGMGVEAAQMIPGLSPGMSGVDFTPMQGVDFTPSMGSLDYEPKADFGGIDFIPEMSGADFGAYFEDDKYSQADWGMHSPEMGSIPEGLI
jgi:hypothetical protein